MIKSAKRLRIVERRQLDERLARLRDVLPSLRTPRGGWIGTLRKSLGVTQKNLAKRLGLSPQAVAQLEAREADGTATLNALSAAAQALGGELVWAIIPEKPIGETLEDRAYQLAKEMTAAVKHTMRLEDQETDADAERRIRELAEELMATPSRLWSVPDDI